MADLSTVDPVAIVLAWEQQHTTVLAELGAAANVSGLREAPWPHLQVTDGAGGDYADLNWRVTPEVTLTLWGNPDGTTGDAEARRLLLVCVHALQDLVNRTDYTASDPVVSLIRPAGTPQTQPLANGQTRSAIGLYVTCHPAAG